VPVVRGDHTALKAILLGVWRVAASSLEPISAAAAPEAAYDRPVWWHWLSQAMTRKRGNQNWARPIVPSPALATEFELRTRQLQLTPEMYISSAELRAWCWQNRNRCYVPEWLLAEWRINVDPTFKDAA
jgi:hypothetical protein